MRGHLGTILAQKAGNVLECTKKGPVFTVSSADARHQEVPSWSFMFADDDKIVDAADALRQMTEQAVMDKQNKKLDEKLQREAERRQVVFTIINLHRGRVSRNTLLTELGDRLNMGASTCKNILKQLREDGAIVEKDGYVKLAELSVFPKP